MYLYIIYNAYTDFLTLITGLMLKYTEYAKLSCTLKFPSKNRQKIFCGGWQACNRTQNIYLQNYIYLHNYYPKMQIDSSACCVKDPVE